MSTDAKERIRARLDIAEVVGEVVALKPAGRGQLKGLCPFHGEKTPSFHVQQDKGFYYCFGCGAKGDVFDFVMRSQGVAFVEALQVLGQRTGIEVTPPSPRDHKRRDLYDVNSMALEFFKSHLPGIANDYLLGRQLTAESIAAFDLGYAPDSWDALLKHALHKGVSDSDLLDAGLLAEADSGRRYDRFRNRIMFPIKDYLGRVVGFSGRVLDDSLPKYMNTPETDVFKKAELLYGLDVAKTAIRSSGECIVVEGYMDVIALRQVGIENVVAALGATLTKEQAEGLSRLDVQKLYLAFDADEAGQRAVLSGLEQSVGRNFLVRAVRVPHGKDPADAVLEGHLEDFRAALYEGISEVEFRFKNVVAKHDKNTLKGKQAILEELLPIIKPRHFSDPVAAEMRLLVTDYLGIDEGKLNYIINSSKNNKNGINSVQVKGLQQGRSSPSQVAVIELEVIALLLLEPGRLRERLLAVEAALPPVVDDSVLREFHTICEGCDYDDRQVLLKYRERDEGRILFERLLSQSNDEEVKIDIEGHILKSLSRLRELYLDSEKEHQRAHLLERMKEVSGYLTDPNLPTDQLRHYYAELKEINAMLSARDAERRMRVPMNFGKGKKH